MLSLAAGLPAAADHPVDFAKEIQPLFEAACIQCHAKGKDKGGFSLETREAMLKGGDDGPTVVWAREATAISCSASPGIDPDTVMPKKGKKWTPEQVGLLRAWIDQGANWDPKIRSPGPSR